MDGYGVDELPDEYAALADAPKVMSEVLGLIAELRQASAKLGDALVAAGLPAREWRDANAYLGLLSDQFPEITVDALITRLAEFSAGMGPHWLRGDASDIARFNDEAAILLEVIRPLRVVAQRLRMLPVRQRGNLPLEQALGDARIASPLDRIMALLRDLETLGPFIVPLSPEQWNALSPSHASPSPSEQIAPSASSYAAPVANAAAGGMQPYPLPGGAPVDDASRPFTRLSDFAASSPSSVSGAAPALPAGRQDAPIVSINMDRLRTTLRRSGRDIQPHRWLVLAVVACILAVGTGLLTLVVHQAAVSSAAPPASVLTASPATLALGCSGKAATQAVTLHNSGKTALTWSTSAPSGLSLSVTHGALAAGASATIQLTVTKAKSASGALAFTSSAGSGGSATLTYRVACQ